MRLQRKRFQKFNRSGYALRRGLVEFGVTSRVSLGRFAGPGHGRLVGSKSTAVVATADWHKRGRRELQESGEEPAEGDRSCSTADEVIGYAVTPQRRVVSRPSVG